LKAKVIFIFETLGKIIATYFDRPAL